MSHVGQIFTITNISSQPCALPDRVTNPDGITSSGTPDALSDLGQGDRYYAAPMGVPVLAAGRQAMFGFIEGDPSACELPQAKVTVTSITFSIGPAATFTADLTADPMLLGCGAPWVTAIGAAGAGSVPNAAAPTYQLDTTRSVPSQLIAGQPMHYTITVTNTGSNAVPLSSCPSYTASLEAYPGDHGDEVNGQLDCGGQTSIPPGGSISFHGVIPVPSQPGAPDLKFGWSTDHASITIPSTGAFISVTG